MVHIKHTTVAGRAVMAPLRLENVAHQTISSSFIFIVTKMETPEDRHLSWICCHRLEERPNQHDKEKVVYY